MVLSNNIILNQKKLESMQYLILKLEDKNSKTKEFKDKEMVEKIRDIIINTTGNRNFR